MQPDHQISDSVDIPYAAPVSPPLLAASMLEELEREMLADAPVEVDSDPPPPFPPPRHRLLSS